MVIPSRWMAGGHGMDDFRVDMLSSGKIDQIVDYPVSKEVFPGVEIKGGICFFLWDKSHHGQAAVTTVRGESTTGPISRNLGEFDVFVRDHQSVAILKKVLSHDSVKVSEGLTGVEPFKWASNFADYRDAPMPGDIPIFFVKRGKRGIGWVSRGQVEKNKDLIDTWKVLIPKAGSDGGQKIPDSVLGKPIIAPLPSVCSGSFIFFSLGSETEAKSFKSYYVTKFFRFLVSLRKITQDAIRSTYTWVPQQSWDRTWTDDALYTKYGLTKQEIDHIEAVIRPMSLDTENADD
jgi:site-specific DNA-methyltransferase (adenine-specific)